MVLGACLLTMAPNRSEFSYGVWISIFLFYCLALSLQSFMGCHCIVSMHVYMILLMNTSCRSSWEIVARVISQWFWCKYPAHNFLLYSEGSEKKHRLSILKWNTGTYPLLVSGAVYLCFEGRKGSMTKHVEIKALPETYWHVFVSPHPPFPPAHSFLNIYSPPQPISTNLDHTQSYNSFQINPQ